jgi:hypothetical protein
MIVSENGLDFKSLEKEIFDYCCRQGCEIFKTLLEKWDESLMLDRDRYMYRHKGLKGKVYKTIMGEVEYKRAIYETRDAEGKKCFVYLLDEALGQDNIGFISELLSEQIVQACCESTYRGAARTVSELTGQTISHTAAWNVVQEVGKRVDIHEQQAAKQVAKNQGTGTLETKMLFEEQDGIMLSLQGKSRKENGPRKEMKLAIAYDGEEKTGKDRYELTNKVACASFEGIEAFFKRKEGVIGSVYNIDEITDRILGGDGAKWVLRSQTDETVYFQLDPFHRNQAVLNHVSNPDARKTLMKLLYDKDIDLLIAAIGGFAEVSQDIKEREHYLKLLKYFENNKDGLVPYQQRGLELPEPPEGKVYRHLGTAESNIFTIIGNRMKGRRACWSIDGGNNMARILCLKFTNRLFDTLQKLTSLALPERYAEEIPVQLSAAKTPLSEGKGYDGFKQMSIASSMLWMKNIAAMRPFSEL